MTNSTNTPPQSYPGRLFLALGLGLTILGVLAYVVQVAFHRLTTPWYLPCLATLGGLCVVVALGRTRTIWRWLALLVIVLLAGAEWTFLLQTRLPKYQAPVAEGKPFPAFKTMRAKGTEFTQNDLEGDQDNVLVFFRGRW